MTEIEKFINQLKTDNPNKRYEACEELRVAPSISHEAIEALKETLQDPNPDVADAAKRALEVHYISTPSIPGITPEQEAEEKKPTSYEISPQGNDVSQMYKSIRNWAVWLIIAGALAVVLGVVGGIFDPFWGIILIVVGIIALRIRISAMFAVFAVLLAGAALKNVLAVITGGGVRWIGTALVQTFFSVMTIRGFRKYRHLPLLDLYEEGSWPSDIAPPRNEVKITDQFAIASFILSVTSAAILSCGFIASFTMAMTMENFEQTIPLLDLIEAGAVDVAILALGLGIGAILSKSSRRGWAIAGSVLSALLLILEFCLILLFTFV